MCFACVVQDSDSSTAVAVHSAARCVEGFGNWLTVHITLLPLMFMIAQVYAWMEQKDGSWGKTLVHNFGVPVWRVSWSVTGGLLAVADSTNATTLWKESLDGKWQQIAQ